MYKDILIIGTGSWGTGLAQVLTDNGNNVKMYGVDKSEILDINKNHKNSKYFPNILSDCITAYDKLEDLANICFDIIILAVPTNEMSSVLKSIKNLIDYKSSLFINVAKGYTNDELSMYEVFHEVFPDKNYYSLLGPSHAEEVINRKLTCVNLISIKKQYISSLIDLFTTDYFKVHYITDIRAAEFYSSIKNVYALMSGILNGLGYGHNARAALLTYSLHEMNLLSKVFEYDNETLFGLCGIGDLVVTCYSNDSRNFTAGTKIGQLNSFEEFNKDNIKTVEGIRACKFVYHKMDKAGLDLTIIKCAYNIIYNKKPPMQEILKMFESFNNKI